MSADLDSHETDTHHSGILSSIFDFVTGINPSNQNENTEDLTTADDETVDETIKKPFVVAFVDAHFKVIDYTVNKIKDITSNIASKRNKADPDTEKIESRLYRILYGPDSDEDYERFLADLSNPLALSTRISHVLYDKASELANEMLWKLQEFDVKKLPEKISFKFANYNDESSDYDVPKAPCD